MRKGITAFRECHSRQLPRLCRGIAGGLLKQARTGLDRIDAAGRPQPCLQGACWVIIGIAYTCKVLTCPARLPFQR